MARPLVCLCLTGKTLAEDVAITERYSEFIDLVELRVDFLEEDERLNIRNFPGMVNYPVILTIRRGIDGGQFNEGEASRTQLFARGLAFAEQDSRKNFAYVDFEEDFNVSSLEDAALAFGTKIIRSFHDMKNPVKNLASRLEKMRTTGYEIPKIAFMPHTIKDVTDAFEETSHLGNTEQILCAMSDIGLPSRILAERFHSYLSYTSPAELLGNLQSIGHVDPKTLNEMYHFRAIDNNTKLFGITGFPLKITSSPKLQNGFFGEHSMNACYIPFKSETAEDAFDFAKKVGIRGFSVTIPHKEEIIPRLDKVDQQVEEIGACNTVINDNGVWTGYNTDCTGFSRSLLEFTGLKNLKGKKVAIIGAGGASRAIAYAVKELGAKACVFNRTISKAKVIAERFGFEYASLGPESLEKLHKFSDVIVQTTSKGMGSTDAPNMDNDPLYFYDFNGTEFVYDIIYAPEVTPIMARADACGCKVCNGFNMLKYQGEAQFDLFKKVYNQ